MARYRSFHYYAVCGFFGYWYNRGLSKQTLGDKSGAISDFKKTLALQPNYEAAKKSLAGLGVN